jgi:23S rRNA pseudouridine1911/1915/1917 synthase
VPPELSTTPIEFVVTGRQGGTKRLDTYLAARFPDFSRSVIQKVIDAGAVLVNDRPARASYKVRGDDRIKVWLPDIGDGLPTPEDIPLRIVFEDEFFVVINKEPGMVVHPAKGNWKGTVVNALQFHFDKLSTIGGEERPGIVHRLDRDTSGLLIVAKEDRAHAGLGRQFEDRTVSKEYLAITYGAPHATATTSRAPSACTRPSARRWPSAAPRTAAGARPAPSTRSSSGSMASRWSAASPRRAGPTRSAST